MESADTPREAAAPSAPASRANWVERAWRICISTRLLLGLGATHLGFRIVDASMGAEAGPLLPFALTLAPLLVALQAVALLIQYLPIAVQRLRRPETRLPADGAGAVTIRRIVAPSSTLTPETVTKGLSEQGFRVRASGASGVVELYGERGALTLAGPSILLLALLIGAVVELWSRQAAFEGTIDLVSGGGAAGSIRIVEPDGLVVPRPLVDEDGKRVSVRCERFMLDRSADGAPRFSSELVVLSAAGNELKRQRIGPEVPLEYAGMTFRQVGYRELKDDSRAIVTITDKGSGQSTTVRATPDTPIGVGEGSVRFRVVNYDPSFGELGPAIEVVRDEPGDGDEVRSSRFWAFSKYPDFDHDFRGDRYGLKFGGMEAGIVTGFRVTHAPGRPWLYVSGALLLLGALVGLWTTHRRVWVRFAAAEVVFAGAASRGPGAFERDFQELLVRSGAAAPASAAQGGAS